MNRNLFIPGEDISEETIRDTKTILGKRDRFLERSLEDFRQSKIQDNDLNNALIMPFLISKKLKKDPNRLEKFGMDRDYCRGRSKTKFKGETVGEDPYNFCMFYYDLDSFPNIRKWFACISFKPIEEGIKISQIQGLSQEHNCVDVDSNRRILSQFKWDRFLIKYVVNWAMAFDMKRVEITGYKNQEWLYDIFLAYTSIFFGPFECFCDLTKDEYNKIHNRLIEKGFNPHGIHLTPHMARERYKFAPLDMGFTKNRFDNYELIL